MKKVHGRKEKFSKVFLTDTGFTCEDKLNLKKYQEKAKVNLLNMSAQYSTTQCRRNNFNIEKTLEQ